MRDELCARDRLIRAGVTQAACVGVQLKSDRYEMISSSLAAIASWNRQLPQHPPRANRNRTVSAVREFRKSRKSARRRTKSASLTRKRIGGVN